MKIRSPHFKKEFDLSKAELIGEGNFAQVYRIFDSDLNDSLAIRKVKKTQSDMEDITKEKVINEELRKVQNENILKIYDIIDTEEAVWYITEYCSGGSLWDVLNLCKDNKMNERQCLQCVLQISKGVQELHNHRITHRDLKPENILLKTKYIQNKTLPVVKLADFGLSTQKIIMETIAGTKEYIAPEQAKFHNYTNAVDVWSLGIICDEILHGTPFYSGENNKQVFNKILKLPYKVRDQSIRVSIKNLLISLLKKKPYERPIIAVIRKTIQKILEEIQSEKSESKIPKKKESKDQSFQSSNHSSNLNKYSNLLGLDSRKIESRKVGNESKESKQVPQTKRVEEVKMTKEVKQILRDAKQAKQTKQVVQPSIPVSKPYNPPIVANIAKTPRQQMKREEPTKRQELKRQISNKKPDAPVERPKQNSVLKTKQSRAESATGQKQPLSQKQLRKGGKAVEDQRSDYKTESSETKNESSGITRVQENVQIPIHKIEKKKVLVPQPKKEVIKFQNMEVDTYMSKLLESKKQLQEVTSVLKAQKLPSFLPNTSFTASQFKVNVSQTSECISQFKKDFDVLNYIQYNDEYDQNVYRKQVEIQKSKKKCMTSLKNISQQLKQQFMNQVNTYVQNYLQKALK